MGGVTASHPPPLELATTASASGNSEPLTTGRSSRKTKMEARSVWMAAAGPRSSRKRAAAETPCPFREDTAKPSKKKKASSLTTAPHVQDSDGGCCVTVTQAQAPDYQLPLKPKIAKKVIEAALNAVQGGPAVVGLGDGQFDSGEPNSSSEFELDNNASDDNSDEVQSGDDDGLRGNPMNLRAVLNAERPQVVCGAGAAPSSAPAAKSSSQRSKAIQPTAASESVHSAGESDPESDAEHLIMAPLHASISAATPKVHEVQSGDDDGLRGNPMNLRAVLNAERPQVVCGAGAAPSSAPAAKSSSQRSKAIQPTAASESVHSAGESDPESDAEHLIMAPLHASISAATPKKVSPPDPTASVARTSAREKRRQLEIPVWTQEPTAAAIANHSSSAATASQDYKSDDGPEDGLREPQQSVPVQTVTPVPQWMPDAHIILNARGQVNIRDQKPHIQVMLRTSISLALHHIAFEDAYPDMNHTRRTVADILYMAANQTPGCERMRARLAQDTQCVRSLSSVPFARISKARAAVKVVAQRHVTSTYQLETGCSVEKIDAPLQKNTFIFPTDSHGKPIRSKLFQSPAIIRTIQDAFFHDDLSPGLKHPSSFISTSQTHPDDLELPPSMVALATTAVRTVIMDFMSKAPAGDFNSTVFCGIYECLIDFVNALHRDNDRKCHVLFALLYKLTRGMKNKPVGAESGEMMLMHIDLDAMAEE
ncbi:hypothetical protein PAXINDRAFT_13029 [Paxillus involutus ATCC 200175]|uniref:DUF6532 domain-containing protein n=1 Tax=Paxillus involutus ATCC 200175 TaxID=664439 RepID=A0A0C9U4I1_PAXIN|nr:hypothetical protein PAXINDRAFT_13029 [Paxillus involutus ATCC 200175]